MTKKILPFPMRAELDAMAAKILPLPEDVLPSPAFTLRTRGLLLGLSRIKAIRAA